MRRFGIATTVVLVTVSAAWIAYAVLDKQNESPHRVMVIIEGIHSGKGVGQLTAISVVDRKRIEAIEEFFPNYQQRPSSGEAGAWIAGAAIYFDFTNGQSVRVTVSQNDDMKWWSVGDGDFEVNGEFAAYLKELREIAMPPPHDSGRL